MPGEQHGLGLLMAEAMLVLEDCCCQSLGVQTPLAEIPNAAAAHRADIVALSFSTMMSSKAVIESVTELRSTLPPQVLLWAGGGAPVLRRRAIDGVVPITTLEAIPLQEAEDSVFKCPISFPMAPRTRHPTRVSRSLKVADDC